MPIVATKAGPGAAAKSTQSSTIASSAARTGGISPAIRKTSGDERDSNSKGTQDYEGTDRGNTRTYSGRTTREQSVERTASTTVGRFQQAIQNSSSSAGGGAPAVGGGGGGAGTIAGGGSGGTTAAWGGAGAEQASYKAGGGGSGGAAAAGGGGGCSGGSCGGGSSSNGTQRTNRASQQSSGPAIPDIAPAQMTQSQRSQAIAQLETNLNSGGTSQGSELAKLAQEMKNNDKAFLVKSGAEWCGPCNAWDVSDKSSIKDKYGYMKIESSSALAKELRQKTGNNGGIPAFYRVSRDKDGNLKVEHLQNGGAVNEIKRKMDNKEASNPHNTEAKLKANLEKLKNFQKEEGNPSTQEQVKPESQEQKSPEPNRANEKANQEHIFKLEPVDKRLEIIPDKAATTDTQQVGICSNGSCSLHTVDFKAENINDEIKKFSDAVSGENSPKVGIQDFNTDSSDQEMLARLNSLISSDMSNEDKIASFKEQVSDYQKRHKNGTIAE